jgi:hypothetical protein
VPPSIVSVPVDKVMLAMAKLVPAPTVPVVDKTEVAPLPVMFPCNVPSKIVRVFPDATVATAVLADMAAP